MSEDNTSELDQKLAKRIRKSVDDYALPDDVQRQLRLARADAVAKVEQRSPLFQTLFGNGRWLLPMGGAAALALAFAMNLNQTTVPGMLPVFDEQELAAAAEMEMLEDMEFIAWMLEAQSDEDNLDES